MPPGASASSSATIWRARSAVHVGWPTWSSTTDQVSFDAARASMVFAKFGPWAPYSHAVRTT